jgi:CBS domain-containing protein
MNASKVRPAVAPLEGRTSADVMTPNPVSIRDSATVAYAIRFLTDKGFSAAPVIDERGRPIGVLSRADILVFDRERASNGNVAVFYGNADLAVAPEDFRPDRADEVRVRDVMTPVVFSVGPRTPAIEAAEEMVRLHVHRMFVVDDSGTLVGVVSALDVLRDLVD